MKDLFGKERKEEVPEVEEALKFLADYAERARFLLRILNPTLRVSEVAKILGVSESTVRYYARKGELKCYTTVGGQRRFKLFWVLKFFREKFPEQWQEIVRGVSGEALKEFEADYRELVSLLSSEPSSKTGIE